MILYHWLVWDDGNPKKEPTIEPWVLDKSQNGTYLNREILGNMRRVPLKHGMRLEVFSQSYFNVRTRRLIDVPGCHFKMLP